MNREDAVQKNLEGLKLYRDEKYEEALRKFNEAIEIDAEYAALWVNRSDVNRKLGREAEADADMERWESLTQAVRTEEPTLRREVEASADMKKAKGNINMAVIAGVISGVITLIVSIIGVWGYDKWSLIDAFLVFGLAFGVYKKSRVCAIILFVGWVGSKIWMMVAQPEVILPSLVMTILFGFWFFRGIQGTFAYHRIIKAEEKQGIPIEQSPKP